MSNIDSIVKVTAIFIEKGNIYDYNYLEDFVWKSYLENNVSIINENVFNDFSKSENNQKINKYQMISLERKRQKKLKDKFFMDSTKEEPCEAIKDAIGFRFEIMHEYKHLESVSGIEWEIAECSDEEVFADYLDEFETKAKEILRKIKMPSTLDLSLKKIKISIDTFKYDKYPYIKDVVNFFTIWSFHSSQDYFGEYDSWKELIGYFNFQDIFNIILKKENEKKKS